MKISIGLRLFASVLLAILAVAASAVYLLRQNVLDRFGDYAVQIELDRLDELSNALARRYARHGSWDFVPASGRREWIARELARLQDEREARAFARPPAPVVPVLPFTAQAPFHLSRGQPRRPCHHCRWLRSPTQRPTTPRRCSRASPFSQTYAKLRIVNFSLNSCFAGCGFVLRFKHRTSAFPSTG